MRSFLNRKALRRPAHPFDKHTLGRLLMASRHVSTLYEGRDASSAGKLFASPYHLHGGRSQPGDLAQLAVFVESPAAHTAVRHESRLGMQHPTLLQANPLFRMAKPCRRRGDVSDKPSRCCSKLTSNPSIFGTNLFCLGVPRLACSGTGARKRGFGRIQRKLRKLPARLRWRCPNSALADAVPAIYWA